MSKTVPVVNEIVERGFVPSPEEYQLLSTMLTQFEQVAKQEGNRELRMMIRSILGRFSQVVQAPGGLRPDQIDRYRERAREGLEQRDSAKLADGVQHLIAATLRTDPDPAEKIAIYLLQLVGDLMMAHRASDYAVLERLSGELDSARSAWDESGWPTTQDVITWMCEIIDIGKDNLAGGRDPWPTENEETGCR